MKGKIDEQQTTPVQCRFQIGHGDERHPRRKAGGSDLRERDISDSLYYNQTQATSDDDLLSAIEDVLMRRPFYGYRRVLKQPQRQGWLVGETRVRRVLKAMGHTVEVGRARIRTTDSSHSHWRYPNLLKRLKPKYPHHMWVADITYLRLGWRFIYLAVILDAYTRAVRGWALSRTIDEDLALAALERALNHGAPRVFHSDQGSQYTAWRHTRPLLDFGVQISMSDTGQPTQDGLAERFIGILKQEHVDYAEYSVMTTPSGSFNTGWKSTT